MDESIKKLCTATFAGGCFWCLEADFKKISGVIEVTSGYTGGHLENPTYEDVLSGGTGHAEAVQVYYDEEKIEYETLLDIFWKHVDPTDPGGQFADRGRQYRTVIFYHNDEQKRLAEKSKEKLAESGRFSRPIVTEIVEFSRFDKAEEYHQDYHRKNTLGYSRYRSASGRDRFLKEVWADSREFTKPGEKAIRKKLTPLQYRITQKSGTEPPFDNAYWQNKREGIYVDVVSGEPLFSSLDKFDSGTGWPSFTKPFEPENISEVEDRSLFMRRIEVRSKQADSHLGHLFPDGPKPTGSRYCINSASLRFVPKEDLQKEGYGEYLAFFE